VEHLFISDVAADYQKMRAAARRRRKIVFSFSAPISTRLAALACRIDHNERSKH
jgi:hypothetical protein